MIRGNPAQNVVHIAQNLKIMMAMRNVCAVHLVNARHHVFVRKINKTLLPWKNANLRDFCYVAFCVKQYFEIGNHIFQPTQRRSSQ
jgi:hypothetical protein